LNVQIWSKTGAEKESFIGKCYKAVEGMKKVIKKEEIKSNSENQKR